MVARCAHADVGGGFRLWPIFSAAALRRKLLEVLTCGGGGGSGAGGGSCRSKNGYRSPQPRPRPRSDRLAELLRAEPSECGDEADDADAAVKKVEALEKLKVVVGALQACDGDNAGVGGGGDMCRVEAATGRRAVSRAPDAVPAFVDVLNWSDEPGCQEKAAYILMVLAHRSYADRAAMAEAGATSALLELTLVGTALAQKRASRILEILRADKGKQVADAAGIVATMSAPQERGGGGGARQEEADEAGMSNEKRAVRQLVQQSLQSNMRRIVRRARLPQDLAPPSRGSDGEETLEEAFASSCSLLFSCLLMEPTCLDDAVVVAVDREGLEPEINVVPFP
uniref:Uncharacterized protein n=1 Tax=Oryza barthii TaxID=65489 RepID=A0A0D3H6W3_9ORYZ